MLRVIVFGCGAALMGLEMVAARVLAPHLGNSIYVWGSVIAVVMIALALGYAIGGQVADRFGPAPALPLVIAAAGVATVCAPIVATIVLPFTSQFDPRLGSLMGVTAIYFIPTLLLAMVSPMGVKLAAQSDFSQLGRSAGNLYAVSTAGCVVGTIATSFWLIPLLSLEPLMVGAGFLLMAMALLALRLGGRQPEANRRSSSFAQVTARGTVALVLVAGSIGGWVLWQVAPAPAENHLGERVLFRADTLYHRITVTEDAEARHLRFDRSLQSSIKIADPYVSNIRYPDYMHLALALNPDPERVLVLGLGGGAVTKRYWRDYPGVRVDSVEIDPVVADVARQFFWLPEDDRMRVFIEDARRFVQRGDETYDIVVIDAYTADSIPFHLTTQEFFGELAEVMSPDGVVVYNIIGAVEGENSDLFRAIYRTTETVWQDLWVFPIGVGADGSPTQMRNIALLATNARLSEADLRERIASRVDGRVSVPDFEAMADDLYTKPVPVADVPLLTDSYAPVDSLMRITD